MANEITKVTDQNGVDHPFKDVAAFTRSEQGVLGAKNFADLEKGTKTHNNMTFASDGEKIVISGTFSSNAYKEFSLGVIPKGTYIINGITGGSSDTVYMDVSPLSGSPRYARCVDGDYEFTLDEDTELFAWVNVHTQVNDFTIYPMIRLASDTDSTYAPYAKTNRELTEDVANIPTVSVTHTGTASSTGVRKQQITVNNVSYDVDGSAYMEQSVTLSTSQSTDVVFTNAIIADGTELTFSSSIWDLVPDDMVTTTGVCTVTLPKWTSAVTIGCRLRVR